MPSNTPTVKPGKNPKRVAAGKAIAEKARLAREAQKKAAAEAAVIIANNKAKEQENTQPAPPQPTQPAVSTVERNSGHNGGLNGSVF